MITVARHLDLPAPAVWEALVDLDAWPRWGPSVAGAGLDAGGRRLTPAATGWVRTAVGVRLPFTVTSWVEGVSWAWRVAGIPATAHEVLPDGEGCRASISVPSWAPLYAPLCWVALGRLGATARDRER